MSAPFGFRLDLALVARGLVPSRARAQAEIAAGHVTCDGTVITKSAHGVSDATAIALTGSACPWVSRGGLKLDHALAQFDIDLTGQIVLDLGASTGGFTEVALARGAAKVFAVDVGHGQLHDTLRGDPRVIALDGVHARDLSRALVPDRVDAIVCDVSFISLRKALPAALMLAAPGAALVALIKPQFEAGPKSVGKGGVVRDAGVHDRVCAEVRDWLAAQPGWSVLGLIASPVTGADGNAEFLIAARLTGRPS